VNVRVGLDIVGVARIRAAQERWDVRFLERVFTPAERTYCQSRAESLAARFAAKEAVFKVLGTGWGQGVQWRDVEVVMGDMGPEICLHGEAAARATALNLASWSVSLTHSDGFAAAVVLAYGREQSPMT